MDIVLKAIRFSEKAHKGQKRKVSGSDYFVHPLGVSYLVMKYKVSKVMSTLLAAAILHDTVEDTATNFTNILGQFGISVASLVHELTDDKVLMKEVGKLEYCKKRWFGMSSYALYIKLCDRLYNISDTPTQEAIDITKELLNYLEKNRKLTKSHKAVIVEIRKVI